VWVGKFVIKHCQLVFVAYGPDVLGSRYLVPVKNFSHSSDCLLNCDGM
jgi:hypothetical protein